MLYRFIVFTTITKKKVRIALNQIISYASYDGKETEIMTTQGLIYTVTETPEQIDEAIKRMQ